MNETLALGNAMGALKVLLFSIISTSSNIVWAVFVCISYRHIADIYFGYLMLVVSHLKDRVSFLAFLIAEHHLHDNP